MTTKAKSTNQKTINTKKVLLYSDLYNFDQQ